MRLDEAILELEEHGYIIKEDAYMDALDDELDQSLKNKFNNDIEKIKSVYKVDTTKLKNEICYTVHVNSNFCINFILNENKNYFNLIEIYSPNNPNECTANCISDIIFELISKFNNKFEDFQFKFNLNTIKTILRAYSLIKKYAKERIEHKFKYGLRKFWHDFNDLTNKKYKDKIEEKIISLGNKEFKDLVNEIIELEGTANW